MKPVQPWPRLLFPARASTSLTPSACSTAESASRTAVGGDVATGAEALAGFFQANSRTLPFQLELFDLRSFNEPDEFLNLFDLHMPFPFSGESPLSVVTED